MGRHIKLEANHRWVKCNYPYNLIFGFVVKWEKRECEIQKIKKMLARLDIKYILYISRLYIMFHTRFLTFKLFVNLVYDLSDLSI